MSKDDKKLDKKRMKWPLKDAISPSSPARFLGGMERYKESDYDAKQGPQDGAHRAFRMPKDGRSRGFLEMMAGASLDDDDGEADDEFLPPEWKRRFNAAAKSGAHCGDDQTGKCGRPLKSDEPVWLIRRKYDSGDVVAPICRDCWETNERSGIATSGPCTGCGRLVHITPKALKLWLARGKRICCCDKCADVVATRPCATCGKPFPPKRSDAQFCSDACKMKAHRRKKVSQDDQGLAGDDG